jgi:hypothetical protein
MYDVEFKISRALGRPATHSIDVGLDNFANICVVVSNPVKQFPKQLVGYRVT